MPTVACVPDQVGGVGFTLHFGMAHYGDVCCPDEFDPISVVNNLIFKTTIIRFIDSQRWVYGNHNFIPRLILLFLFHSQKKSIFLDMQTQCYSLRSGSISRTQQHKALVTGCEFSDSVFVLAISHSQIIFLTFVFIDSRLNSILVISHSLQPKLGI